ncbi:acyl-CoA N-acyltransferase [Russula dissimulans]|nr:acyl-CoA N-acyltransferase [Russula dissimulans]
MSYVNSYKASDTPALLPGYYGPDPYDINWIMPLHKTTLESERIKLTPFIPALHAKEYAEQTAAHPELHRWFPIDVSSLDKILTEVELRVRRDPTWVLFAIIDKAREDKLAGLIGLKNASPANLSAEIAWILVFPAFQRTTPQRPGLGLRRVQWTTHTENEASWRGAKRMGFREEGVLRWSWVNREKDPKSPRAGRNSVVLSLCADDWENGGREHRVPGFFSSSFLVYSHPTLHVLRFLPPKEVYPKIQSRERNRDDLQLGDWEALGSSGDALCHKPARLQDDQTFRDGVSFAPVFDLRFRDPWEITIARQRIRF